MREICAHLKSHGVIVYPTDTLYGLGAYALDPIAIERIFELKRMEPSVLSVAFHSFHEAKKYAELPRWTESLFPGPVTVMARAKGQWKYIVKDGKIGIRVPDNSTALGLLKECGPLTSTSANIHGREPLTSIEDIKGVFGDSILYVKGEEPKYNGPSTIIDVTEGLKVIRKGVLPIEYIESKLI